WRRQEGVHQATLRASGTQKYTGLPFARAEEESKGLQSNQGRSSPAPPRRTARGATAGNTPRRPDPPPAPRRSHSGRAATPSPLRATSRRRAEAKSPEPEMPPAPSLAPEANESGSFQ